MGPWGSREVLPAFGCRCCTRCDGLGLRALSNVFLPQRQGMPSFIYQFSFSKSASLFSHIPRCGDVSSLGTAMLHTMLLTCLGRVSLKQNLSKWEKHRSTSPKSIFLSIPLLPWKRRLVMPLRRIRLPDPEGAQYLFVTENFYTDSFLGKEKKGKKKMSFFATTSLQSHHHL